MKHRSIDRGILRFRQCEIVLSIAAILLAKVPICAEEYEPDDELAQPVPVLTQTVQSDAAKTVRRYPARIRAVEQVDVVSRLSADIDAECAPVTKYGSCERSAQACRQTSGPENGT